MNEPLSPEHEKQLGMALMMHRIVGFAFIAAIFIYSIVVFQKTSQGKAADAGNDSIVLVLYLMAIGSIIISPVLKNLFLRGQQNVPRAELTGERMAKLLSKPLIGLVVAMALCESSALFGLVLAMQTGSLQHYLVLAVLGLVGCVFHFPRYENYKKWVMAYSPS